MKSLFFLSCWYEIPGAAGPREHVDWPLLLKIREAVSRELELLRAEDKIRAGLDADVDIYCSKEVCERLSLVAAELRFVFITSDARIHNLADAPQAAVEVEDFPAGQLLLNIVPSDNDKCGRCWHRRPDVGSYDEHPELCGRCIENIDGDGETRRYA